MGGPFFVLLRAVCPARLFFLVFLTQHVNDQGSSRSLSLQDEPHISVAVPDCEGDHTSDLPKHDESMDIDIVHTDVGVVDMDIDIRQANTFATGTSGTCPAATPLCFHSLLVPTSGLSAALSPSTSFACLTLRLCCNQLCHLPSIQAARKIAAGARTFATGTSVAHHAAAPLCFCSPLGDQMSSCKPR
ncbi:hypothetical protein B0H14DRAFT_2583014 [Mycena olivaceomarginata]|nr:hypothetical protein B0H14DRAFT_2583014 [Mycena olivaceomarginata]